MQLSDRVNLGFENWNPGSRKRWAVIVEVAMSCDPKFVGLTVEEAKALCLEILGRAFTKDEVVKILTDLAEKNRVPVDNVSTLSIVEKRKKDCDERIALSLDSTETA